MKKQDCNALCKICGTKFQKPHNPSGLSAFIACICFLFCAVASVAFILNDNPTLFLIVLLLFGGGGVMVWYLSAMACPECGLASSVPLSDKETVNKILAKNKKNFQYFKKRQKNIKRAMRWVAAVVIGLGIVWIIVSALMTDNPCSNRKMSQAYLHFTGRYADAEIDYVVQRMQDEYDITGTDTGWVNTYYGTPICHIRMKSAHLDDKYVFWNPAKKTWELALGCYKSYKGYECN